MNKYNWSNKEKFLNDWNNAKNKCDFLKANNLTATSGNYATFNKWLKFHNENILQESELSYNEIFIEKSPCNRKHIKILIENNNLIPYQCAECSNIGRWNGKPIKLQLEHKNGISNDHRLENLEYLCPNCHSQTSTYSGKNIHSKVFVTRIEDLKKYSLISLDEILKLSKQWNISMHSVRSWLIKYKEKIIKQNIILDERFFLKNSNNIIKDRITVKLINIQKNHRLIDIDLYKNNENIVQLLSIKWNISRYAVKSWFKRNAIEYYNQADEDSRNKTNKNIQIIPKETIDFSSRVTEVVSLTNKKEVLALSKKWNTSVNGAKKWIRNNLPDKFIEIYDDKHLIKNQKIAIKKDKISYVKSLEEGFNEIEAMTFLDMNKSALYTQIKLYNPLLLEKIHNQHLCPKCHHKSRSNGQYRRCLDCNHNFKPQINNAKVA